MTVAELLAALQALPPEQHAYHVIREDNEYPPCAVTGVEVDGSGRYFWHTGERDAEFKPVMSNAPYVLLVERGAA